VASKPYIELLRKAFQDLHGCQSKHLGSVPVHEVFRGKTVWEGDVEVFALIGHPKAKRGYAWSHPTGEQNKDEQIIAVLEIPPVISPRTAVQAAIISRSKKPDF
jgi:hypothetical protein